jgi:peroxiredoxin
MKQMLRWLLVPVFAFAQSDDVESLMRARVESKDWSAAARLGRAAVDAIESGKIFARIEGAGAEAKIRGMYAQALEGQGLDSEARHQRAIAAAAAGESTGDTDAIAIAARENARRVANLRADLLATETHRSAPPFQLKSLDGRVVALDDFRGRIVIAEFWAEWCAPCAKELDELDRIFAKEPRASLVTISLDEQPRTLGRHFEILKSDHDVERAYTSPETLLGPSIPRLYVIDASGNIRFQLDGFDDSRYFEQKLNWMIEAASK